MKNQNGFTRWIIVILISIMAIGLAGLGWYYQNSKNKTTLNSNIMEKIINNNANLNKSTINNTNAATEDLKVINNPIPDTGQTNCFDATSKITCPSSGQDFYGQDAQYSDNELDYTDNGDGTITDNNTGLIWIKEAGEKDTYYNSINSVNNYSYAGYSDWRVPTIKELYSLMDFDGQDIDPTSTNTNNQTPFIDEDYFEFKYGDLTDGDRIIDSQWITNNIYNSKVMNNEECFFGVNFADGRIKCYPTANKTFYMRLVRGMNSYGTNDFIDNNNGTVTDNITGLTWQQTDNGRGIEWPEALDYCENLDLAGYQDWRLPNIKELQYIVDYSRSPDITNSAALDSLFQISEITNELGNKDYPFFWSSTTHSNAQGGTSAAYISFGRALGKMNGRIMDVHGAGAQRSDPKIGDQSDYPDYHGPQGDVVRVYNYARCVR